MWATDKYKCFERYYCCKTHLIFGMFGGVDIFVKGKALKVRNIVTDIKIESVCGWMFIGKIREIGNKMRFHVYVGDYNEKFAWFFWIFSIGGCEVANATYLELMAAVEVVGIQLRCSKSKRKKKKKRKNKHGVNVCHKEMQRIVGESHSVVLKPDSGLSPIVLTVWELLSAVLIEVELILYK